MFKAPFGQSANFTNTSETQQIEKLQIEMLNVAFTNNTFAGTLQINVVEKGNT